MTILKVKIINKSIFYNKRGKMVHLSTALQHYKRPEIQEEMILHAENKEIAVKYGDKGFGKRPDILKYKADILELAKQGATSFHSSEEIWKNPLHIVTGMKKKDAENLRTGFDLVLDIDCPFVEYSKIAGDLLVKALRHHGIKTISAKFSGNKGFHIGVPFESFPEKIKDIKVKNYFPEGVRAIAEYLSNMIMEPLSDKIIEIEGSIEKIQEKTGKSFEELTKKIPNKYGTKTTVFDAGKILEIDTILISSRHMYRMPFSLHEKSGLVSLPINPDKILEFKKEQAIPKNIIINKEFRFIDRSKAIPGEASALLDKALYYKIDKQNKKIQTITNNESKTYEEITEAIPEQCFPPCMKITEKGMEDGKKRFLFCVVNFLASVGWDYGDIEKYLKKWNEKNPEQLREVLILGQVRYHKQNKKKILPPNCNNKAYYHDLLICHPDNLCNKIKNPVQYAKRRAFSLNKKKKKSKIKTEKKEDNKKEKS